MYTRSVRSYRTLIYSFRKQLFIYVPYVTGVYVAYEYFEIRALDIKMSIATVLGFAVSLLLGFRTSASYDRWWEARKIWGGIVNDSRTLVRQLIAYTGGTSEEVKKIAQYQIAWTKALKNALRDLDVFEEITPHLSKSELDQLQSKNNKHSEILKFIENSVADLHRQNKINDYQQVSIDQTIRHLCDHMGKAERINNTVFPTQYRSYTHRGIIFFTAMLPFGMLLSTGPFVILICTTVSFLFFMLENIASYLQDPFNNRGSDIPMTTLCRTIEINILDLLGEDKDKIPKPLKPDEKGILM